MRTQKSAAAFGFDRYDKGRLQRALAKETSRRMYVRLKAVLLIVEGAQVSAVAKLFGKSSRIVYRWIAAYLKHHQPSALLDAPRSGRPVTAQALSDARILAALKRNPLKLGYNTTVWTVAVLAEHLMKEYNCVIHPFTLYRRMRALGLRAKRPRYFYSEKDPDRAQKKGPSCEN